MRTLSLMMSFLALAIMGGVVAAHSELVAAQPAPGAHLAESPTEIRLTFSEPVAGTSQIVVLSDNFQPVEGLVPQYNPEQPQEVYTPLPPLAAGVYTVQWTAASADGHEISGSYSFSVGAAEPSGASTPGETTADEPATVADEAPIFRSLWWLAAIALVAVGLPVALLAIRRTRHPGDE